MIKINGQILTPKQAAKIIIEDGLGQGLNHWEVDTYPGEELDRIITDRERELINNQKSKLLRRIFKILS